MADAEGAGSTWDGNSRSLWFVAVTLGMVGVLLIWYVDGRIRDYRHNQQALMEGSVTATANELALLIAGLRGHVRLFAEDRYDLIAGLARDPGDLSKYRRLEAGLSKHFPHRFAFTIADRDGGPLLEGLDDLVGHGCREDISRFARRQDSHPNEVYIHSSPGGRPYHFDIVVPWGANGTREGVFFVSFFLTDITRLLRNSELPGHGLLLVRQDDPVLIEVTAEGARDELSRVSRLSAEELDRIGARRTVEGSRWVLYDLPRADRFADYAGRVRGEAWLVFALFAVVSLAMLVFIRRAETALRRSNRELSASLGRLRQAQTQLVRSEKMAALGGLVAGVAHEINTPVGIGVTAASHLQGELAAVIARLRAKQLKKSELQAFLDSAGEASTILLTNLRRAADLVRSFKLVATDQTHEERRRFELKPYLEGVLLSLRPKFKRSPHSIILECPEHLALDSYPGAVSQVLTNLVDNALTHAFPPASTGHMRIRVEARERDLLLRFEDDGKGMPPQVVEKVFDPFFTTNREGGGSGLGLHIVYNVVRQTLGGDLRCESVPDQGTVFVMEIPLTAPVAPASR